MLEGQHGGGSPEPEDGADPSQAGSTNPGSFIEAMDSVRGVGVFDLESATSKCPDRTEKILFLMEGRSKLTTHVPDPP